MQGEELVGIPGHQGAVGDFLHVEITPALPYQFGERSLATLARANNANAGKVL